MIEPKDNEIVALVGHDGGPARAARAFATRHPEAGYVPSGRRVFHTLTVAENLAVGAYRRRQATPDSIYGRFPRLHERRDQTAGTLSGGEQQLLVIARALMAEPPLLILEDPSAGLGPPAIAQVAHAIKHANTAVLIADENLALARAVADRVVLIHNDAVVLDAPAAQALADERLGVGYITGSSSRA